MLKYERLNTQFYHTKQRNKLVKQPLSTAPPVRRCVTYICRNFRYSPGGLLLVISLLGNCCETRYAACVPKMSANFNSLQPHPHPHKKLKVPTFSLGKFAVLRFTPFPTPFPQFKSCIFSTKSGDLGLSALWLNPNPPTRLQLKSSHFQPDIQKYSFNV